jgi:hypothetical protein
LAQVGPQQAETGQFAEGHPVTGTG